jgi:hypothetical protein
MTWSISAPSSVRRSINALGERDDDRAMIACHSRFHAP